MRTGRPDLVSQLVGSDVIVLRAGVQGGRDRHPSGSSIDGLGGSCMNLVVRSQQDAGTLTCRCDQPGRGRHSSSANKAAQSLERGSHSRWESASWCRYLRQRPVVGHRLVVRQWEHRGMRPAARIRSPSAGDILEGFPTSR